MAYGILHPSRKRKSGVAPANQTKERAKTKSLWISPTFVIILLFFLRKTSTIHKLNFCSGMPLRKVHELTFLWFGLPGPLLRKISPKFFRPNFFRGHPRGMSVLVFSRIWRAGFRERPPGLIQHVLTVLAFWSWVLLLPWLPPSSRSLRAFPWASILLHGPLDICLDLLPAPPLPPVQKRDAQHMFLLRRRGAVCTAGRTSGATSEKFRGFWGKLLRSCPKMRRVWWFPHKGNFWEVRGQLLKITPKAAHKLLRRSSIRSPTGGYCFSSSEQHRGAHADGCPQGRPTEDFLFGLLSLSCTLPCFLNSGISVPLPTPKKHQPKSKQFVQTICTNSFCCFQLVLEERGDCLYKLFRSSLHKLCCYLGGWFFGVGFPFTGGKKKVYQYQSPPFSKKAMQWGKNWPVRMNLPFFTVEAYVPGGGGGLSRIRPKKVSKNAFQPVPVRKSMLAGIPFMMHAFRNKPRNVRPATQCDLDGTGHGRSGNQDTCTESLFWISCCNPVRLLKKGVFGPPTPRGRNLY